MARPTKYSEPLAKKICEGLRKGYTRNAASARAGVSEDSLVRWVKNYAGFAAQVRDAEAEAESKFTDAIYNAADEGDWKAGLEWLKRRRREEWGDNIAVSADKRIDSLVAALFPEETGSNTGPDGSAGGETSETFS